jgi:hypothetical protein
MAEINIKVDVPEEFKEKFELSLAKAIKQFVRELEFGLADEILLESKLTDEQVEKLSDELKTKVAERHGLKI